MDLLGYDATKKLRGVIYTSDELEKKYSNTICMIDSVYILNSQSQYLSY